MRPQEELHWKTDTDKRPAESHFATPLEGPVTDLPHPELFAAEPSTGRHVVVIHPPLIPCDARSRVFCHWRGMLRGNPNIDRHYMIAPSTTKLDDVLSNVTNIWPYDMEEDIVSVQFTSICSPFLATTHVPCSQAGHIRTTPH